MFPYNIKKIMETYYYFVHYVDTTGLSKTQSHEKLVEVKTYLDEQRSNNEYYIILPRNGKTEMQYLGQIDTSDTELTYYINFYLDKFNMSEAQMENAIETVKNAYTDYFPAGVKVRYFSANYTEVQRFILNKN